MPAILATAAGGQPENGRRSGADMEIAQLFFSRYEDLRDAMTDLVACPDAEWRARPHGLNPITWLIWHMARAEDSGLTAWSSIGHRSWMIRSRGGRSGCASPSVT